MNLLSVLESYTKRRERIGLFIPDNDELVKEIACACKKGGLAVKNNKNRCLCEKDHARRFDAVIAHPHDYKNSEGCWYFIRYAAMRSPDTLFYIMAIRTPERREAIGDLDNVVYLENDVYRFFKYPADTIRADIAAFKAKYSAQHNMMMR